MTSSQVKVLQSLKIANACTAVRHLFIRDYMVDCSIGIHNHEKECQQRVRINLDLAVYEGEAPINDDICNVICYEHLAKGIDRIVGEGHVNLVETLAEKITAMCLEEDQVFSARVRVEKLDIMSNAKSVGVEIEKFNSQV